MDPLICKALGLSDAPWPPDDLTLVGLTADEATPDRVEAAVLERMERLRVYQLTHPEPVTEAMNRLARALDALTGPAEPPAEPDPEPPPFEPSPLIEFPSRRTVSRPAPVRKQPHPPAVRPKPPPWPVRPGRERFYELARQRRLLRAWDGVGALLTEPNVRPTTRLGWVEAVAHLQSIALLDRGELATNSVFALARNGHGTQALIELTVLKRKTLADAWRMGRESLVEVIHRSRRRVGRRMPWHHVGRWLRRGQHAPEVIAALIGGTALIIAMMKLIHQNTG